MLLLEQLERQYLADRTGLVTALLQSEESEVTPPSFDEQRADFDAALYADPVPVAPLTDRDRSNRLFLDVMGAA